MIHLRAYFIALVAFALCGALNYLAIRDVLVTIERTAEMMGVAAFGYAILATDPRNMKGRQ